MKKSIAMLCIVIICLCPSCKKTNTPEKRNIIPAGNIQNGGYIIKVDDCYIYANADDNNNLYKSSEYINNGKKISGGHYFYEMNPYDNEIYYTSSSPGKVWKISKDGSSKKRLINQNVGNMLIYDNHIYYRLSEDDDWGKLYSADINGKNKVLLKENVKNFCIYNGLIYYFDISNNALCSMNINGANDKVINHSRVTNIFVQNNMLIYSDHNRQDKLFTYDLKHNVEKCISEDACWNINANSDWILYKNQSDHGNLYCVSFDGKRKFKLAEENISDIIVIDDIAFYRNINKNSKIEYVNINNAIK